MDKLSQLLCEYTGRKYCILTGRATSGAYIAYKSIAPEGGRVLLPDIVCPHPASAALYAGLEPVFCDVDLQTFTMDIDSMKSVMDTFDDIKVVMPVHLYGHIANLKEIIQEASRRDIRVIEDAAQSIGGYLKNKPLGSFGDCSLLSFGRTKILDVGYGGAVLTDDAVLAERMQIENDYLSERPSDIDTCSQLYRKVFYTLYPLAKEYPSLNDLFLPLPKIFKEMYLFKFDRKQEEKALHAWDSLEEYCVKRKRNGQLYRKLLDHPDILHPLYQEGAVPWRYTFLLKSKQQKKITEKLRLENIDVSNWYSPLHRWYLSGKKQDENIFRNSIHLETRVINLWLEPSMEISTIHRTTNTILQILNAEENDKNEQIKRR